MEIQSEISDEYEGDRKFGTRIVNFAEEYEQFIGVDSKAHFRICALFMDPDGTRRLTEPSELLSAFWIPTRIPGRSLRWNAIFVKSNQETKEKRIDIRDRPTMDEAGSDITSSTSAKDFATREVTTV